MRFKCKYYGDKRVVKRFALFPIRLYIDRTTDRQEIRWFEVVYIFQKVDCGIFGREWQNRYFVTRDEYQKYTGNTP